MTDIMAVSIAEEPATAVGNAGPPAGRRGALLDPLALAALAAVVSGAAANRPSLWYDEGATISAAADRSLPQLWHLLGHIDAVHGLYYLLMHGWFAVFPPTEFWSRVPSALAVGAAAAGVVVFTKQFSARLTAVCAGAVFAILPRVTWAGVEARSYALSAAAAVWLAVLLVAAIRRDRWAGWLLYALGLMASVLVNVYLVLLVPAFALAPAIIGRRKSTVIRWAIASAAAVAITAPFLLFAHGQVFQVAWISRLNWRNVIDVGQHQYFENSVPFGIAAGVVAVAAAVAARRNPGPGCDRDTRRLMVVCAAWIVVPTAVTLGYSAFGEPLYYPRYLTFTAPAMAVVLAACIVTVTRKPWAVAGVLLVFAGAAAPNYLFSQRTTYAKESWDYSQVADLIGSLAAPGDCLLVDNTVGWKPGPIRALLATRPAAFAALADIERGGPGPEYGHLWDGHVAVWLVLPRLHKCSTVWTITSRDESLPGHQTGRSLPPGPLLGHAPVYQFEGELGFRIVERWQFHRAQVTKSTR